MDEAANSPQLKPAPPERGRPEQTVRPDSELDRSVAFAAFYRNGWHDLVAFVMWLGANLQDAQNIAQETMTRAYSRWETIDHPKTWIRTVVSHEYGRSAFAVHDDPVDELPEMPDHGSDEVALFGQEQARVLDILPQLPPRQRQVMAWTYDGYAPAEIAELLHVEPNAVRVSLYEARQKLKERLAEEGGRPT